MKTEKEHDQAIIMSIIAILWFTALLVLQRVTDQEMPNSAPWIYLSAVVSMIATMIVWMPTNFVQLKIWYERLIFVSFTVFSLGVLFTPPD